MTLTLQSNNNKLRWYFSNARWCHIEIKLYGTDIKQGSLILWIITIVLCSSKGWLITLTTFSMVSTSGTKMPLVKLNTIYLRSSQANHSFNGYLIMLIYIFMFFFIMTGFISVIFLYQLWNSKIILNCCLVRQVNHLMTCCFLSWILSEYLRFEFEIQDVL